MSRIAKFASRDDGLAARMGGFIAHLRWNGLRLGVAEAALALEALSCVDPVPDEACRALKAACAGCREEAERFEALFDAYWRNGGRIVARESPRSSASAKSEGVHSSLEGKGADRSGAGAPFAADSGGEEAEADGEGKLFAVRLRNLSRKDLRHLVRPGDVAEAERVALRLGAALRDRRSRRRKASRRGETLNFRKIIRRSLSTGGEPVRLWMKSRPDRPRRIVALCDVSGSMSAYARVFLSFLAGLMRADRTADAYLFHVRLVRISDALRDRDSMRAIGRMSLMADGFGGGSRIGWCVDRFARGYARRFVDGRSVVLILSDGYDTDSPELLGAALERLRKRGCRIAWLNPLKNWAGYEPVAGAMQAALPHIDFFGSAGSLSDLAALEPELARLR